MLFHIFIQSYPTIFVRELTKHELETCELIIVEIEAEKGRNKLKNVVFLSRRKGVMMGICNKHMIMEVLRIKKAEENKEW